MTDRQPAPGGQVCSSDEEKEDHMIKEEIEAFCAWLEFGEANRGQWSRSYVEQALRVWDKGANRATREALGAPA